MHIARGSGLVVLCTLAVLSGVAGVEVRGQGTTNPEGGPEGESQAPVRMLCLGDVNLGRHVGQVLLRGDTLYPWRYIADSLHQYDIVFANLESNLSDQGGLTEDPRSNTVFTGPPSGAASLERGGITVVSTANNHAMDFGLRALQQTCALLDQAHVAHAGSARDSSEVYAPALLSVRGLRVALFASTEFINGARDAAWQKVVASPDTGRLFPLIRKTRDSADVIIVSIHGGVEYNPAPAPGLLRFAREAVDAGADVVLGHHPHVPYAVFTWHGGIIAPSLGNCVFKQPFTYWTQRSFALSLEFRKNGDGKVSTTYRCYPLHAGYQPRFLAPGPEFDAVMKRVCSGTSNE
ncbi:MAG: CapA family protein [Bacteroidota bacterium]